MVTPIHPSLKIVVPSHQAGDTLRACLEAILSAGFIMDDVLVVDDGSRDGSADIPRALGIEVLRNEKPERPARARNIGVKAVRSDIVLFIDSDVVVHPDIRSRFETWFSDPEVSAVIGSYDDDPPAVSVVSRYRNLLHSFTHQRAAGPTSTFWTGLGAVRRDVFLALGGLDRDWENIEDVEFGLRLVASGGRIVLDPEIRGKHLKKWTTRSMFRTDLHGRAVPWTRLLRSDRIEIGHLNTSTAHRASAAAVLVAVLSLPASVFWTPALLSLVAAIVAFLAINAIFFIYLAKVGGAKFAIRAIPFHAIHYLAALLGYAKVRFLDRA